MKTPLQQINQQMQQRQRDMEGYAWTKGSQRQAEIDNPEYSEYSQKKSGGFANLIWITAVGIIIYFLFFSH